MGTTLVVNPGSSSKKYALYNNGESVIEIRFEKTDAGFELCTSVIGGQQTCEGVSEIGFSDAFAKVFSSTRDFLKQQNLPKLDSIVVRVVSPGTFFQKHAEIDDNYLSELNKRASSAPLHIPTILKEIKSIQKHYPKVKLIAASDSAFHAEMPIQARDFSIAKKDVTEFDIHRFGYHGLSVSSVARRVHSVVGCDPSRMVVCHIGNGVSVTAVKDGKSVDTTMGFSPTSGLPMGSRAGDIDSAALLELMRVKNFRPTEAEMYLNTNGGLFGIAQDSDIRRLLDRRSQHDLEATQALDTFSYNIQKAVAAMTVALGGIDTLVLTATAAVRSSELRCLILRGLTHLGVDISQDKNDLFVGKEGVISTGGSKIQVVVMKTDEMGEMEYVVRQLNLSIK